MAKKESAAVPLLLIVIVVLSVCAITVITVESTEPTERVLEVIEWPTAVYSINTTYSIDTAIAITPEEAKWESEELIRIVNEESGVRYMLGLEGEYLFKYRPSGYDELQYESEKLRKKIEDLVNKKRRSELRRQIVNRRQKDRKPQEPSKLAPNVVRSFANLPPPRQTYKLDGIRFEIVSDAQEAARWRSLQEYEPTPTPTDQRLRGSKSYYEIEELREEIDNLNDEIEDLRSELDREKRRN